MSADRSIMQGRYRYLAGWVAARRDRRAMVDLRQTISAAILDAWREPGALGGGSDEPLILPDFPRPDVLEFRSKGPLSLKGCDHAE